MRKKVLILLIISLACSIHSMALGKREKAVLNRVFSYAATLDSINLKGQKKYTYMKSVLNVRHKNVLLAMVPSMYAIARSKDRQFIMERYTQLMFNKKDDYGEKLLLEANTIPHKDIPMETTLRYFTPNIYSPTIFQGELISPFHRTNKRYYRYTVMVWPGDRALVRFRPKIKNTQLVEGTAMVDITTGRIIETNVNGNFDMINFDLNMKMNEHGAFAVLPKECSLNAKFSLLGNKLYGKSYILYDAEKDITDSIKDGSDTTWLKQVRPKRLTSEEQSIYDSYYARKDSADNTQTDKKKSSFAKKILWGMIGENLLTRIRSNYGTGGKGYFRMEPILNPFFLGYSHRRGLTYKMDLRTSYNFCDNQLLNARAKIGYSFKQRRLYYKIPITYYFDKRHNGNIEAELGNGNLISSEAIMNHIRNTYGDSIRLGNEAYATKEDRLFDFKDYNFKVSANYDFSSRYSVKSGFVCHRRTAKYRRLLSSLDEMTSYRSVAPMIELKYRPTGYDGPVITADYERSIKGLCKSNTEYERWEFDAQYKKAMERMQTLSLRAGYGFYTNRGSSSRFLDYSNFRENNIVSGWNDDWTGEFELLDANKYNNSDYYMRANATYESPLLTLSWLPLIGKFVEMERIYAGVLNAKNLHPYIEVGYGFSCRAFSMGMFASLNNGKFDRFGCRLGFELFRQW